MQKYKTELFLILILLFFWEAEFFILDIWPNLKGKSVCAQGGTQSDTAPVLNYALLNEFIPNPTGDDKQGEFIELYNPNLEDIDLESWQIDDIKDDGSKPYIFPAGKILKGEGYLLLPYSETKVILNNDEDWVRLLNPQGEVMEEIQYEKPKEGESYNKIGNTWYWSKFPTPGGKNTLEQNPSLPPSDTAPQTNYILINELLPDPEGDDKTGEFIELFNNSDTTADLTEYTLQDQSGKKFTFESGETMPALSYRAFYTGKRISLNNDGDKISLLCNGQILEPEVIYEKAPKNQSYNRQSDGTWAWSTTLTPSAPNIITQKTEEQTSPKKIYPRHIWINEFLPNPSGKDIENEFIELYNKGPNEIDLESWQVDDKEDGGSRPYTFPENSKIGIGEYLTLPYSQTKIALNNDEDWVRLLWPDGQAIDEIEYEEIPEGQSYNKIQDGWRPSTTPTPGEQNIITNAESETTLAEEKNENYSRSLWINEFLPDPKGKDTEGEFIELQNRSAEEIDLEGWQLDDIENDGSRPYTFPKNSKISPHSYLLVYYQDSKISLNNDGDWVRLLNPNGEAIDEIQYPKAPEGKSYSRQNIHSWKWTNAPTPDKDNEFTQILATSAPKSTSPSPLLPQTGPNLQFYLFSLLFFILPIFFFPKRLID